MPETLTPIQQRVLVSLVEGAGTTQRFGRWKRSTIDALQRKGHLTVTKAQDGNDDIYPVWRIDLTASGRQLRTQLLGTVEPIGYPPYPAQHRSQTCLHDPLYPEVDWRCALKTDHTLFHRYKPEDEIEFL